MTTVHVVPHADWINHDTMEDCACGPREEIVKGNWVVVHHSLDGRERYELGAWIWSASANKDDGRELL